MVSLYHRLLSTEVIAGLGVLALSLGFGIGALSYDIGALARMQAGYFPLTVGVIGALLGLALIVMGILTPGETAKAPALRPVLLIPAAFIAFSLVIDRFGLLPAIVVCGTISAKATPSTSWRAAVLLSVGLAIGIWLLFVVLLSMPIPTLKGL
ncbi:MAG: tripartite tricarboxylate transporter TctB family protein [Roseovarius sp.]